MNTHAELDLICSVADDGETGAQARESTIRKFWSDGAEPEANVWPLAQMEVLHTLPDKVVLCIDHVHWKPIKNYTKRTLSGGTNTEEGGEYSCNVMAFRTDPNPEAVLLASWMVDSTELTEVEAGLRSLKAALKAAGKTVECVYADLGCSCRRCINEVVVDIQGKKVKKDQIAYKAPSLLETIFEAVILLDTWHWLERGKKTYCHGFGQSRPCCRVLCPEMPVRTRR